MKWMLMGLMLIVSMIFLVGNVNSAEWFDNYNTHTYLPFNGTEGSTAFPDYGLSPHNFTGNSGAHINRSLTDPFGQNNGVIRFDGVNDVINASDSNDWDCSGGKNCTIDLWVYIHSLPTSGAKSLFGQQVSSQDWFTYVYFDGRVAIGINGVSEMFTPINEVVIGKWYHFAFIKNSSDANPVKIFINGTERKFGANQFTASSNVFTIGGNSGSQFGNWSISDFSFSNYTKWWGNFTRPSSRIGGGYILLNSPENNYNISDILGGVSFNCSAKAGLGATISNITFWHNATGTWHRNQTSALNSIIFTSIFPRGNYLWTCSATDSDNNEGFAFENRTIMINPGFTEISQTFNSTTYEQLTESFIINITYNSSYYTSSLANLWYNGTSYTGTKVGSGDNVAFTKSLTMANPNINKSFLWQIGLTNSTGTFYSNSTFQNQTVNPIVLGLCNSTLTIPYINFTFKDESTDAVIGAKVDASTWTYWLGDGSVTKTLSFSNTSASNPSYAFCFTPQHLPFTTDLEFKYSNTSYPLRTFSYDNQQLTNSTTNKVLYLLGTADGIYSAIQTQLSSGSSVSGVLIVIERQINNIWVIVGQDTTGSDGLATFWVNPNFQHRITATKTNYVTQQVTITPSQATYTIVMSTSGATVDFISSTEGLRWKTTPPAGSVAVGSTKFNLNLTASLGNLDGSYCKFELARINGTIIDSTTGGSSGGCNLSITYVVQSGDWFVGKIYVDTTNSTSWVLLDADQRWVNINGTTSTWQTFDTFLQELKDMDEWGECSQAELDNANGICVRKEFSRVVFFFLFLTILTGIFTFFTQFDTQNPSMSIIVPTLIIWVAAMAGWFSITLTAQSYQSSFLTKHGITLIMFFFSAGSVLNYFATKS